MYATKLMMNQNKIYNYVEDDSLLRKLENQAWGVNSGASPIEVLIPKVTTGINAFTYCGTLPIKTTGWLAYIMYNRFGIYRTSGGVWNVRLCSNGSNITTQLQAETEVQPFVVVTMYCPDETTQVISTKSRSRTTGQLGKWYSKTGNYAGSQTSVAFKFYNGYNEKLDLALVYDRVLSDEEIEQNFNAFVQRHRQEG